MKLDNKGFLITGILYSLLILFLVLIIGMLAILSARQGKLGYIENNLITKLNDKYKFNVVKSWDYDYTGNYQTFTAPTDGFYSIELWGASGGYHDASYAGKGAYTSGTIFLSKGETLYVYVGQAGSSSTTANQNGTWNGGGVSIYQSSQVNNRFWSTGGGATDIRLVSGAWNNFDSLKSRIMVAGAGGGAYEDTSSHSAVGGAGGTFIGLNGDSQYIESNNPLYYGSYGFGGTQILGGYSYCTAGTGCTSWVSSTGNYYYGGFGYGGNNQSQPSAGGGSGYYGGGASFHIQSAGGGSSFISGLDGCNAITEASTQNNITHTNQPNHYSGKVFEDGIMIAGNSEMPSHTGTTTVTGNVGNGYARISLLKGTTSSNIVANFDANGGKVDVSGKDVKSGVAYGTLPTPTREGYRFLGWNGKNQFYVGEVSDYFINNQTSMNVEIQGNDLYGNGMSGNMGYIRNERQMYQSGIYTFHMNSTATNVKLIFPYDSNGNILTNNNISIPNFTYNMYWNAWYNTAETVSTTIPNQVSYYKYGLVFSDSPSVRVHINDVQIEEGSVATAYEPYYITASTNVVQEQNHTLKAIWEKVNLVSGKSLVNNAANLQKIDDENYTMTTDSKTSGAYFPVDFFEQNKSYVIYFKIQKQSGTLINITGHSTSATQLDFKIDGVESNVPYLIGITSPRSNISDDTNVHEVYFKFKYNPSSAVDADNKINIQPNRAYTDSVSVKISDLHVYEVTE